MNGQADSVAVLREQFEAWYRNGNSADSVPMDRRDGRYIRDDLEARWCAWTGAYEAHAAAHGMPGIDDDTAVYADPDTRSIHIDWDDDPQNQLSLIVKRDGSVAFAAFHHGQKAIGDAMGPEFKAAMRLWAALSAQGESGLYAVFANSAEYPDAPIRIPGYAGSVSEIREAVMAKARREGYTGDFVERMAELGWWLQPLYLHPAPPGSDAVHGSPEWYVEELRTLADNITGRGVGICNGAALTIERLQAALASRTGKGEA